MKSILISALALIVIACQNNAKKTECNGVYVKINSHDSLCLNLKVDIDSTQIKEVVSKNEKVLLVFTGFTMPDRDILSRKFLANSSISELLKDYIIIKLNVDNTKKRNDSDSLSIGNSNYQFQIERFKTSTQPFHVILDKNLNSVGSILRYTQDTNEILTFLKQVGTDK